MVDDVVVEPRDGTRLSAQRSGAGSPLVLVHGGVVDRNAIGFVEPLLAERHEPSGTGAARPLAHLIRLRHWCLTPAGTSRRDGSCHTAPVPSVVRTPTTVDVTDAPSADDVALISDALDDFNVEATGTNDVRPLAVLVRDAATDTVVGGLTGRTSLGLLFIDLFHLPPAFRGHGLGSEILQAAEDEGRRRGCRSAVLYTISFQAPGFYARNGWRVFGEVPCDPPGTSRVFMSKDLVATG